MEPTTKKTLTIRFTEADFKRLKLFSVNHDVKMTDYIRGLIDADLNRIEAEERKRQEDAE